MCAWRKAYGALKDSAMVGLAKVNSEFKELDIAIVRATNHEEYPPKERHVRKILAATSAVRPRADLAYCIYTIAKRLAKTHNWVVALKTLIVIHRTLRENDPSFKEELLNYAHRGNILQISNFKDDSSPLAWDCSAWVRTYALFLEERLECFKILKYDIEAERLVRNGQGAPKGHSRTRTLGCQDLLEQMPALQQLLYRLVGCQPEGAACGNYLIQYALALVLKESFKIYCGINDGIINLVDMFFEMSKHDAIKAAEIYKKAGLQAESLSNFYDFCKNLDLARNFQFPTLRQPPPSFLATMEEYIREAPHFGSVSSKNLKHVEKNLLTLKVEEEEQTVATENQEAAAEKNEKNEEPQAEEPPALLNEIRMQYENTGDFLSLDMINSVAAEIEESNALALAISQPGVNSKRSASSDLVGDSGWELALITAPSNSTGHVIQSKLAGGFDKLLLDSLYEDTSRRQQIAGATYTGSLSTNNTFNSSNPFFSSNSIAAPLNIQMAMMEEQQQQHYYQQINQQHFFYQHQQMPHYYQTQNPYQQAGLVNPFGDSYDPAYSHGVSPEQGNTSLI